jgi:hypothetical protein
MRVEKWRSLRFFAAAALAASTALLASSGISFSEDQRNPELVKREMSVQQVEALMGPSSQTCWNYDRGAGAVERICFRDGMVHTYGKKKQDPGSDRVYFETRVAPDWPPVKPASSAEVSFGMGPDAVARLLGKPGDVDEVYWVGQQNYDATFVDGKLKEFSKGPPLVIH